MSQVITNAFETYWQGCLTDQVPVVLDEVVLADIPDLDITAPIDPNTGLPTAAQIVHRHPVDQRGRINNNAVAYSIVMDTSVGNFSFNAMYLVNKASGIVGMIVYKGRETKTRTDPITGTTGNSLVKSMLMEYEQAATTTVTIVEAGTWQIDYSARLRGMDEDLRLQALRLFGHDSFVDSGFKLVNEAGNYRLQPGIGYVGGLRVELTASTKIEPGAKPVDVWIDVHRVGTLLSTWANDISFTLAADLTDYVDAQGYPHFVAKLATINADGSVVDRRRLTSHRHHWSEIDGAYFPKGSPLPDVNMGPIWHDDYHSWMTWQVFNQNGASYTGYASTLIGSLLLDTQPIPREGYIKSGVQNLSRTAYAALRGWAIHHGMMVAPGAWQAGTIQVADNADGETFRLFDVRGQFLRALDDGRGVDPSRLFGSSQRGTIVTGDPTAELPGVTTPIGDGNYSKSEFLRRMSADPIAKNDYQGVWITQLASNPGVDLDALNHSYGAARPNNTALLPSIKY